MPVWIQVDQPMPYKIYYPYRLLPWNFGGYTFNVRHDGKT